MKRIIVSIVSEQTVPNYLFIKEKCERGIVNDLLFVSSEKFRNRIEWIVKTIRSNDYQINFEEVIFLEGEEERWEDMESRLLDVLSKDNHYVVNLTGGTKYMSLLVQHVFEQFESEFAYIPYPKNYILVPRQNTSLSLKSRLSIKEYMSNYGVDCDGKLCVKDASYTDYFFDRFIKGNLDFDIIDALRNYRDRKIQVSKVEFCLGTEKYPQIKGLNDFLKQIRFPNEQEDVLTKYETQYLTGGWFEEYMYHKIKANIHPQDIGLGILIRRTERSNQNDLDVVFTLGNKLFVIECKTGIDGERMFNETVYKATAIKETVLGLSANTFIVSLAGMNDRLKTTARNMGISYKCREDVLNLEPFMDEIRKIAHDHD